MRAQFYGGDVVDSGPDLLAQLHAALDGRVDDDAAGKRLVRIQPGLPALAKSAQDFREILLGGEYMGEAARRLDAALGGIEPRFRQKGRKRAVLRRPPGMKTLGHGAEHLAQAGRLRGGKSQRPGKLLLGKPDQL